MLHKIVKEVKGPFAAGNRSDKRSEGRNETCNVQRVQGHGRTFLVFQNPVLVKESCGFPLHLLHPAKDYTQVSWLSVRQDGPSGEDRGSFTR
jgi:hypothetical protein